MAYKIVCQKIAACSIDIFNEASLQLHLGTIIKDLGQLYEFSANDHFIIELEKPFDKVYTSKSSGAARCDIALSFKYDTEVVALAFIELKYFKVSCDSNSAEASKDNRFGLFMDIENLETYRERFEDSLCYEIAIAQNKIYADPAARSSLKTGNGCWTDQSRTEEDGDNRALVRYAKRKPIDLKGNYMFEWSSYADNEHCLIIKLQ